ncbi:hypothetical protein EA74_02256 [Enterococcus hirae]|nr:hypothetical protein EA74_02256 [Enterococcus hirae]
MAFYLLHNYMDFISSVEEMTKTSIEEYLDQEKVSYEVFNFRKTDPTSFQEELKKRQIDPESIGKTLVLKVDKTGVIIAVVP